MIPVGFLSRLFIPRSIRRALHPTRAVRRTLTPKVVKKAQRALHPIDNAIYSVTRSLTTKPQRQSNAPMYHHGSCPVNHRTPDAARKCRNH